MELKLLPVQLDKHPCMLLLYKHINCHRCYQLSHVEFNEADNAMLNRTHTITAATAAAAAQYINYTLLKIDMFTDTSSLLLSLSLSLPVAGVAHN
jgi:hypothetical protein